MAESFFGALKNERVHRTVYPTLHTHEETSLATSSSGHDMRLHVGLGYKSPHDALDEWTNDQDAA